MSVLFLALVVNGQEEYNAEKEILTRTAHYREVCKKYNDPRRSEYKSLFTRIPIITRYHRSYVHKAFLCSPQKTGSQEWHRLFKISFVQVGREADQSNSIIITVTSSEGSFQVFLITFDFCLQDFIVLSGCSGIGRHEGVHRGI